ncbi:MAG: hypothetical protein A2X11_11345 [Bacteroidetes bacterium GWE2_42_24]|nr:MAG: hypothetical protein A2X11_11345 [Bacteroidetes bacterium GWE2_42_24]OFY28894.1 MAG: hypothetical protein A2X09_12820 [Bacteroidetes bacterium GWF2_43_11]
MVEYRVINRDRQQGRREVTFLPVYTSADGQAIRKFHFSALFFHRIFYFWLHRKPVIQEQPECEVNCQKPVNNSHPERL